MSHRKLSNFEVSQIVHYGARVTSKKTKDGNFTHEAETIRNALRLGAETSLAYTILGDLPNLMKCKEPMDFILKLLEDCGLVDKWSQASELTVLSGTVGDDRRRGSIRRISEVPTIEE